MLAALTLMVALLVMSMAVALPKVREEIQRDHEVEAVHRGKQYTRAIQLYYRRFRTYPPDVKALEGTSGIRYLRNRYVDPLTGKDDWQPIFFGQNKVPTAFGFFGEPLGLGGVPAAGVGLSNGNGVQGASPTGAGLGVPPSGGESSADTASSASSPGSSSGSGNGLLGQTFGAGGLIGISPVSTNQSILIYKTKNHYNEWEFVYDPLADLAMRGLLLSRPYTGPPVNTGAPGFNFGSTPTNPTNPTDPSSGAPPSQDAPQ